MSWRWSSRLRSTAAILIFKRQRPDDTVLFIDASRDLEQGTNQNRLRPADLANIVQTYRRWEPIEYMPRW